MFFDNKQGATVQLYQPQSDHPRLVPQLSGKLKSSCIWACQLMVDHFIDITYVHLTRSTNQEENLTVKEALEIWAAIFGVKVNRYHKDIGRFSEQPFRSEIEDSNQTIKVFGVGYYHQNDIVERKIKTLILGSRTLLIHEKL